eukprot:2486122-Prymnesium_polylepis.1
MQPRAVRGENSMANAIFNSPLVRAARPLRISQAADCIQQIFVRAHTGLAADVLHPDPTTHHRRAKPTRTSP